MFAGLSIYLTQTPMQYSHRHVSDAGFSFPIPDRFVTTTFCERPSWQSEGMMLYSTGQWIHKNSTEARSALVTTDWHGCGIEQITCTEQGTSLVVSNGDISLYPDTEWHQVSCFGDVDTLERVIKRGALLLRVGCAYDTVETQQLCEQWLTTVRLGETRIEKEQFAQWKDNDQRGDRTLEYAEQLIRVGRLVEADELLTEMESRFDGYKWRGTEKRLSLHLDYSGVWTQERQWLSTIAQSIPVDEIDVLRLVVLLSLDWRLTRWRLLMPDEIGDLVDRCDGHV